MKTTLPENSKSHQEIIEKIAGVIKDVGKTKISHIILFGSFARGTWQNELKEESDGTLLHYISDYDFLVITKHYETGIGSSAINLENKIKKKIEQGLLDKKHHTSIIIEPLTLVNKNLKKGQYFFSDIKKEGILYYEDQGRDEKYTLNEPKELSDEEMREVSQEYFDDWFDKAKIFFENCEFNLQNYIKGQKYLNISAFNLHQVVENLLQCCHLVFTNYRPKIHGLDELTKPLIYYSKELLSIFPQNNEEEKNCYDLLKRAYVEARYNKNYSITKEQLEYLAPKVKDLQNLVKKLCQEKINSFDCISE